VNLREFGKAGHWPTLLCAFLYFDVSFLIWVLIGALINLIIVDIPMSPFEKGLLVGTPILGGAVLRLVLGIMGDYLGGRRAGLIGLAVTFVPMLLAWLWVDSYAQFLLVGLGLGIAGASFAVALPLASRWYPPHMQGLVMGIAGAGNSGTAIAVFFGPILAAYVGWRGVFAVAMIPLAAVAVLFACLTKDSPNQPPPKRLADYLAVLRLPDTWRLCLLYSLTFGGFVGLASFLNVVFHTQYGLTPVQAGTLVTVCVIAGSFLRPVGGYLADRLGGINLLILLCAAIGVLMLDLATNPPPFWGMAVFVVIVGLLGLGNGAVFQLVPLRFPKEIGVVTGIVGAAGGVGGFFLPTLLGGVNQLTGSYTIGYLLFAALAFLCVATLFKLSKVWEGVFVTSGGQAAPEPRPVLETESLVRS
jgi:NNP family nitrate/nitrite transporter-like MFS transporter